MVSYWKSNVMYKQFSWSLQGSKWAITMPLVSMESTLLFLLMWNFLQINNFLIVHTFFLKYSYHIFRKSISSFWRYNNVCEYVCMDKNNNIFQTTNFGRQKRKLNRNAHNAFKRSSLWNTWLWIKAVTRQNFHFSINWIKKKQAI